MKIFITAIVFIGLTVFLVTSFLLPEIEELMAMRDEMDSHQRRLDSLEEYIKKVEDIEEKRDKYEEELKRVNHILPVYPEMPAVFSTIEEMIRRNDLAIVSLGSVSVRRTDEAVDFKEVEFSFNVFGGYPEFKNLIDDMESLERIIKIDSIRMEREGWSYLFSVEAKTHFFLD